jgi:DNA-binding IclR family transcriptional regulator
MPRWSFLTNHAQVLLYVAHDPDARLIDVAAALGITERSAFAIVNDLARAGYLVKEKDGRRNRYEVQSHLLVPGPVIRSTTVEQLLALLVGDRGDDSSVDALPSVAAAG